MRVLLSAGTFEKGDFETNFARHQAVVARARAESCAIAVFPEFSLTGSVDPVSHPEGAVTLENEIVTRMVEATAKGDVGILFGLAERSGRDFFITQVFAARGEMAGVQRKGLLGEGEEAFTAAADTTVFEHGASTFATIICAEAGTDGPWDTSAQMGASIVFFCAAPGLYGRRTDEASWRAGFEWWESCGVADARHHAARLGLWTAMATQAGSTVDEDFPGIAALISPTGVVVDRLPDWRPGTLVVDIP